LGCSDDSAGNQTEHLGFKQSIQKCAFPPCETMVPVRINDDLCMGYLHTTLVLKRCCLLCRSFLGCFYEIKCLKLIKNYMDVLNVDKVIATDVLAFVNICAPFIVKHVLLHARGNYAGIITSHQVLR